MPLVGLGGYVLRSRQEPHPPISPELCGEFNKIKISTSYDKITGILFLNYDTTRTTHYDGIKIRLNLHLKPIVAERVNASGSDELDLFENCPIETTLTSGSFRCQKRLNFTLDIRNDRICPTSFISSNGSLTYRLVALIKRQNSLKWDMIVNKLLLDFKGYYNISGMSLSPSVDFKQFYDGKITSIFTINKPVLLIGRDTNVSATLELEGIRHYNVDVTVTLLRKTKCLENVKTEIIALQKQQNDDCSEDTTNFKWNFDVPNIARVTYVNEFTPVYSVQYFVKYEATFKPISDEKGVCVDGNGIVEVKVATTCDSGCSSSTITDRMENLTLLGRRDSVTSMITLPPAYSQLSSRSGSVFSLETQPPGYDDLF